MKLLDIAYLQKKGLSGKYEELLPFINGQPQISSMQMATYHQLQVVLWVGYCHTKYLIG